MGTRPKVVSLFAGCGGSSLGYKMAGYEELLAIDFDQDSVDTFRMNFPETPVWLADITQINAEQILQACSLRKRELDILDSSPPCQGFSTAGKREVNDSRNSLFEHHCRMLTGLQPKVFVMENVSGMAKGKMKGMFLEILKRLKDCGYVVKCKLMNAANYDVPQSRCRLIFIGVRKDLNIIPSFPKPTGRIITVRDAFRGLPKQTADRPMKEWLKNAYYELDRTKTTNERVFKKYKGTKGGSFSTIRLVMDRPSVTLIKSEIAISGLIHPTEPRYLTEAELKRICSFPDSFKFTSRTNACKRMGNAVMPNMMKAIATHIRENILEKTHNGQEPIN